MNSERLEEILPSIRGLIEYIWNHKTKLCDDFAIPEPLEDDKGAVSCDSYGVRFFDNLVIEYEILIKWMKEREGE